MPSNVKIVSQYRDYTPPVDVYGSLQILLRNVPAVYLAGLYQITLTDSECVRSSYKGKLWSEKSRIRPADCRGLYHKGHILLLVDQIFFNCPELLLLIPPVKTVLIGEVLYHEIGHHIHRLQKPGYRADKEAFADKWKETLLSKFVRHRYWYLAPVVRFVANCIRPIARRLDKELAKDTESIGGPA